MELLVDMPEAQANLVGSDATVSVESAGTGQTRITAEGVGGDLAIFWRPKRTTAPAAAPVLKAQGVLEMVVGEGDFQATARLSVQSLSEPFQSFTVKLPPGMRLTPSESPEYEITLVEPAGDAETPLRQKAVVRLRQPTIGPVTVRLDAASGPQARKTEFIEVGGFEIDEAVEQWGRALLVASAEDSVSWVESANIVQSSEPLAPGEAENVAAQFRYFAQPFSLQVKVAPQRTRLRVEPTYLIEVFSDQVKLTANLAYQIRGAKTNLVRLDLQGWKLDTVGGDDVVNPLVNTDQLAPLNVLFSEAVAGDVTVRLTARRIVEGAKGVKGSLRIPLPAPVADFAVSALVAVAPNDNIELTPLAEQMHGLIPEAPAPLEELEIARKAAFFYRTRTGEPQPVFAAEYEVKEGEVTVQAEGEIRIQEQRVTVRQEFAYNFAYEPVDRLVVEVPREAHESGELQLHFDDSPIPAKTEATEAAASERVRLRITPPMALGRHVLALEYSLALPEIAPQQTIAYSIPLSTPAAHDLQSKTPRMLSNTVRLTPARPLQAAPDGTTWQLRTRNGRIVREESVLTAEGPQEQLPLTITHQKSDEQLSNAVDRLWLQTWLTASQRRDHAAMQVVSHEARFRVRLPAGADPESLIVILDGRRLAAESLTIETSGRDHSPVVAIDLESVNASPFELEFWYGFTTPRETGWSARLAAPEFLDVSWVRQIYWQLVLPPDEVLVATPAGYTPEHVWRREGWWWRRTPTLSQRELEQWSGASEQPAPPGMAGEHLFSSFGAPQTLEVRTISRPAAVLGWSGFVLVLGLLLLRVDSRRQLRWLAFIGLAGSLSMIAALALLPEMALTALQCATVGAAGVGLAWIFGRIGTQRAPRSAAAGVVTAHSRITASVSTRTERRPVSASPLGSPQDSGR
jgi:hypothetical protein